MDISVALQTLMAASLEPLVYYSVSGTVAAGQVISQSPASGTSLPAWSQVVITVSTGAGAPAGSVVVPNVVGMTVLAANAALAAASVSVDKYIWAVSPTVPQGVVISQSISGGTPVVPGAIVKLTLSAGAAGSLSVPTVTVPLVH